MSILYRITRREDVQPFRVRQLQALLAQSPADPHLVAFLLLFKARAHLIMSLLPVSFFFFGTYDMAYLNSRLRVWVLSYAHIRN